MLVSLEILPENPLFLEIPKRFHLEEEKFHLEMFRMLTVSMKSDSMLQVGRVRPRSSARRRPRLRTKAGYIDRIAIDAYKNRRIFRARL